MDLYGIYPAQLIVTAGYDLDGDLSDLSVRRVAVLCMGCGAEVNLSRVGKVDVCPISAKSR